ncbi:MAG: hypothetical protein KAR40_15370 [Candidatus Sabulitectum sp.]|nr:hypothetical protein [Candidatus Sabulitectum sp.]
MEYNKPDCRTTGMPCPLNTYDLVKTLGALEAEMAESHAQRSAIFDKLNGLAVDVAGIAVKVANAPDPQVVAAMNARVEKELEKTRKIRRKNKWLLGVVPPSGAVMYFWDLIAIKMGWK